MTEKERERMRELEGMVQIYERQLDDMQKGLFFVQDEDGLLRRWYPPRALRLIET